MEKLTNEVIHKEIDLIQACINRIASNLFMVKGWMVTLVATIIALLSDKVSLIVISGIATGIILCFWYLDAFFLKAEKLYRFKYEWVIKSRQAGNSDFLYDLNPYNKKMWDNPNESVPTLVRVMFTKTLIPFYGIPFISGVTILLLSIFKVL